jgi:hypothetical protein
LEGAVTSYGTNPYDYAYMLLRCGIVSVHRTKDMHNKIEVHQDVLEEMLQRRNIMTDRESDSYCFVSYGQIFEGALKEKMPACGAPVSKTKSADLLTLRIGKPPKGGKPLAGQKAVNSRGNRPKFIGE